MPSLSTAARDHDSALCAVLDQRFLMKAPRDDLAVLLDRDLLAGERHLLDERADHERLLEALRRAVDRDLNHSAILPLRIRPHAGVVQWQNGTFPRFIRGFDSLHPLHELSPSAPNRGDNQAVL